MRKISKCVVNLILTISVLVGAVSLTPVIASAAPTKVDEMKVYFIDVGQGDSTLITCGNHSMLIDAGDDSKGTTIQNYLQKQKVEKLDYLVLTHPDADSKVTTETTYILNTNTKKFHYPTCNSVNEMAEKINRCTLEAEKK